MWEVGVRPKSLTCDVKAFAEHQPSIAYHIRNFIEWRNQKLELLGKDLMASNCMTWYDITRRGISSLMSYTDFWVFRKQQFVLLIHYKVLRIKKPIFESLLEKRIAQCNVPHREITVMITVMNTLKPIAP